MSFKDLIPWRRNQAVPVQRQQDTPVPSSFADDFGLAPFFRETQAMFDRFFEGFPALGELGRSAGMPLDLVEHEDRYELSVELPGVDEKDIDLSLADGSITIRGEKRSEHESKEASLHRVERSYGRFERMLALPEDVDPERVSARFDKGVLRVELPRDPSSRARRHRIPVRRAGE